jgi:aspartyl-tRNA(Asn)/glutamyl-tRNA(Gln) amidotransferase subunit A
MSAIVVPGVRSGGKRTRAIEGFGANVLHLSLGSLASKIRAKQISPVEVTRQLLERIDSVNAESNAYITVLHEEAIGQSEVNIHGYKEHVRSALTRLTGPTDLNGFHALSIRCGFSASGLPVGLQLVGRPFDEANLYRFGHAFEQANPTPTSKAGVG